jgi:hypothetical protein
LIISKDDNEYVEIKDSEGYIVIIHKNEQFKPITLFNPQKEKIMYLYCNLDTGEFTQKETAPTKNELQSIDGGYISIFYFKSGKFMEIEPDGTHSEVNNG